MTDTTDPALEAFREATRELTEALEAGGAEATLPARIEAQAERFRALQARLQAAPRAVDATELAEASAAAERALTLARQRWVEARRQLEETRSARAAARRRGVGEPTARFISRRV